MFQWIPHFHEMELGNFSAATLNSVPGEIPLFCVGSRIAVCLPSSGATDVFPMVPKITAARHLRVRGATQARWACDSLRLRQGTRRAIESRPTAIYVRQLT